MNIKMRIIATLLAVLTMLGSMVIAVGAAEVDAEGKEIARAYLHKDSAYNTPEEKLASMEVMLKNSKYWLYVDKVSGEIALYEPATGNTLFSNPYDVASSKGSSLFSTNDPNAKSAGTKEQVLMSQVIVNYMDNGAPKALHSFEDAAMRNQINVSKIKNGVRVEYTIGQEAVRKLVPRQIPKASFEENILKPLRKAIEDGALGGVEDGKTAEDNHKYKRFNTFYTLYDPNAKGIMQFQIDDMKKNYPYLTEGANNALYVITGDIKPREINELESIIKEYCSDTYSFEQMDMDHEEVGYEAKDEQSPVFKLALEYSLDDTGLAVRVPCNGLQYNTAAYTLENISILPYMGAGNTINDGYNFYPDGSGSLFDFNLNKNEIVRGKIYGTDYAYHQISGKYQKSIRVPVYGTVADEVIYSYSYSYFDSNGSMVTTPVTRVSNTVMSEEKIREYVKEQGGEMATWEVESYRRGYVAIIESGESLAELEMYYAGALSDYATMSNYFNPKPKDSYDIADSISVTSSSVWTVVSNRKYTGSIKIHYQMLGDDTYDASWLGMAEAYRNYLVKQGKIQRLTEDDVEADIPLYMEVFGALETQQTIATLPVNVMTPLTTFADIYKIYDDLSSEKNQVYNINFKLTGFANGGMYSTVPSALKWEKAVGGKDGFRTLVTQSEQAAEDGKHMGIYPDFDFAYASQNTMFDSLNLKKDGIKTIDNRYTSKRQYSATQQKYVSFFQLAISPSRYEKFYEKLMGVYEQYGINTMSVASLGTALNSDFDEDDPYNREDCKDFTVKAFENLSKNYSLMTEGGNAYSWAYVDHILDLDLDSSRYVKASCSVPFLGAVLHGYVQFAGAPFNEEGDTDYALLKAIENGAGLYFVLSKQNTHELKEDQILSQYYSIRYDYWKEDVVSYYSELNEILRDVQTSLIVDHQFLNYNSYKDFNGDGVIQENEYFFTERVLDADELDKDILEELNKTQKDAEEQERLDAINKVATVAEALVALYNGENTLRDLLAKTGEYKSALKTEIAKGYACPSALLYNAKDAAALAAYLDNMGKTWKAYEALEHQYALAEEAFEALKKCKTMIYEANNVEEPTSYDAENPTGTYQTQMAEAQLAAAKKYLADEKAALDAFYSETVADWKTNVKNNPTTPEESAAWETDMDAVFATESLAVAFDNLYAYVDGKIDDYNAANAGEEDFEAVKIESLENFKKANAFKELSSDVTVDTEESVSTRYHVSNNNVVAVTYGDIVGGQKVPQKTFILNYNNYAVRVTYNQTVYTVEAGGYVWFSADKA